MKNFITKLESLPACMEAIDWLRSSGHKTPQAAWDECQRGDWMLWLIGRTCGPVNSDGHRKMTKAKAACARLVLHHFETRFPDDKRPRLAIEAAEAYASGQLYVKAATADASAHTFAAHAAAVTNRQTTDQAAFRSAVAAVCAAACAGVAVASDAYAELAAVEAADAADAAYIVAAAASRSNMLTQCASEVRKVFPNTPCW